LLGKMPVEPPEATFAAARARYFEEIAFYRRKPGADVLVDKMPIRTADTAFVSRLFPEWRYIFSIRHPFDVVLSCFKQRFVPNPAMENFRSIAQGVRLYDVAMSEWFKVHTMDDPAVHYVRYEELVTDFDRVAGGGVRVPWRAVGRVGPRLFASGGKHERLRRQAIRRSARDCQSAFRPPGAITISSSSRPPPNRCTDGQNFFGYPTQ